MAAAPQFFLAFDHRNSYRKALVGVEPERLVDGKVLVAEALNRVMADRASGSAALLTDLEYGRPALAALDPRVATAVAIEKSGQDVFEVEDPEWAATTDALAPTFAKVLIRYRADDPGDRRSVQIERLQAVQSALQGRPTGFLLEIITPFTDDEAAEAVQDLDSVRLPILQAAVADLLGAGLDPEVWKVEGLDRAESCRAFVDQCRAVRDDVGVVVLGAGAPADTVDRWLAASAAGGYTGFAVGRSIWSEALIDWASGAVGREEAVERIVGRYEGFVSAFNAAAQPT